MKSLRRLAFVTAAFVYALIVLGAVVRVTGSGLGCGDQWPLCQDRLIPPLNDLPTLIEWSHRLVAAGVSALVVALAALALLKRQSPGVADRGGPLRPALLAAGLLVVQVLLGAVTVWLALPPPVITVHLATALALLAVVLVVAYRAGGQAGPPATGASGRATGAALGLTAIVLLLGGLTASTGAGFACLGFPLCSGQAWPRGGLAEIQWIHRLGAFALVLHLLGMGVTFHRRGEPAPAQQLAWTAAGIGVLQVVVAAVMVTHLLPTAWRALHAAVGAALWAVLVWLGARTAPGIASAAAPRQAAR
jgi:heme A synthase